VKPENFSRRKPGAKPPRSAKSERDTKPAPTISPARDAAFYILSKVMTSAAHSDDLLHSAAVNAMSPEDRNLATALVLGVLRWQLQLDAVLRPMLQHPDLELHPAALLSLRLGLFQLLHMDRIPPHAAVHESVELARAYGAAHAAAMVNAILRRALREKAEPKRATLAVALTPAEQAHPDWLLSRWRKHFGMAAARRIAEYDQQEPPVNALFARDTTLPQIDDGSRLVAELAAASVASPRRILDCCAAPGGKTAVLAVRHPQAEIFACDMSAKRLEAMRTRMDRSETTRRVKTLMADMTDPSADTQRILQPGFDLILCDAPCSGTGTLARNPEIRFRLREIDLQRQAERQQAILTQTLRLLAPGGRLIYSTCSLEPEENVNVIEGALRLVEAARLRDASSILRAIPMQIAHDSVLAGEPGSHILRTLPGTVPCDGFFAAVFEHA